MPKLFKSLLLALLDAGCTQLFSHSSKASSSRWSFRGGVAANALGSVVLNTGDGLKTLDAVADTTGLTATIRPTLDSFRSAGL